MKYRIRQWIKMVVQNVLLPLYYNLFRWKKINTKRVILADAHHKVRPAKLKCYYDAFIDAGYDVLEIYENYQNCSFFGLLRNMLYFMRQYASTKYVVICDNFLPAASCSKRLETEVVQVWHGCGALKKFGYDSEDDIPAYYRGNVFRNYSLIPVSGPAAVGPFSTAMRADAECVRPIGVGYTDCYFNEDYIEEQKRRFYEIYPEAEGKKIVLWAPTFRGTALEPEVIGKEAVEQLAKQLGSDYFVVQKLHPHIETKLGIKCPMAADDMLCLTDVLITDYSSIIFLYAIFKKPLILFVPDLEEYQKNRGFYLDFSDLPGRIVTDEKELYQAVLAEMSGFDEDKMHKFFDDYMGGCDGKAMVRLLAWMEQQKA